MDETAIPMAFVGMPGNICEENRACKQRVSQKCTRTFATLCCTISSLAETQSALPQYLLVNEHTLTAAEFRMLTSSLNLKVLRRKSAWTSGGFILPLVEELGAALAPWKATHQVTLLLDCAPQHVSNDVLAAGRRSGIWIAYIPGKVTFLIQPADTAVFHVLKARLA